MSTKHTPGPHKANNGYTILRDRVRHFPIHAKKRGMIGMALREGDATLWAAAPDLLALVKDSRALILEKLAGGYDVEYWQQVLADVDAAIAKATGESL